MNYSDFTAGDFAKDEFFQAWVFNTRDESAAIFWKSWLLDHPDKRAAVEEARQILQGVRFSNYTLADDDISQLWNRIHQLEVAPPNDNHGARGVWYKAAAAVALVCLVGLMYLYGLRQPWKVYHTAFGETRTFVLPDGSTVVLNANSKLTLQSDWNNDRERDIYLDGEAFFSVVHKPNNQLFKVHTKEGVTVEVLGTTFNVYDRTNGTKVVLNSGQIRLNLPTAEAPEMIVMKPGEMVEYKAQHYNKKAVDPQLYSAWTDNRIILNHTSLGEMINMLEDNYGLDVIVENQLLLEQTVSGSMPLSNADILLQQLGKAFQLKITRVENNVMIEEE